MPLLLPMLAGTGVRKWQGNWGKDLERRDPIKPFKHCKEVLGKN